MSVLLVLDSASNLDLENVGTLVVESVLWTSSVFDLGSVLYRDPCDGRTPHSVDDDGDLHDHHMGNVSISLACQDDLWYGSIHGNRRENSFGVGFESGSYARPWNNGNNYDSEETRTCGHVDLWSHIAEDDGARPNTRGFVVDSHCVGDYGVFPAQVTWVSNFVNYVLETSSVDDLLPSSGSPSWWHERIPSSGPSAVVY